LSEQAELMLAAYQQVVKEDKAVTLKYSSSYKVLPYPYCPKAPYLACTCPAYRTSDGSCNNLEFPWWGKAETPNKRLLPSAYDDFVTKPRTRSVVPDKMLPNARSVAMKVFKPHSSVSEWSTFMTYFGQYIDHDATLTAQSTYNDGYRKFCSCNSYDPDCFNIPIPKDDYANEDQTCMSVVRSMASVNVFDCFLSPREQLNVQTSWLDLSQLYGYSAKLTKKLRGPYGTLKATLVDGKEYLPQSGSNPCFFNRVASEYSRRPKCYLNGDPRTEDNNILTSINTMFLRYHNQIARKLYRQHPDWSSDAVFEQTRRIVIAVYNNIIYNEYLPSLLGSKMTKKFNLEPQSYGYLNSYDRQVYPAVINEFATAAFRYGHTQLPASLHTATRFFKLNEAKPISHYIFNNEYYREQMDSIVRGTLVDWSYAANPQVNSYLLDNLFADVFYMDSRRFSLPALNIQRGRDHGLPGYNAYREKCGLNRARKFEDFTNMSPEVIEKLKKLYASVEDVDLFVGLSTEYPMEHSLIGPTAGCKFILLFLSGRKC
jgi:peroxidase